SYGLSKSSSSFGGLAFVIERFRLVPKKYQLSDGCHFRNSQPYVVCWPPPGERMLNFKRNLLLVGLVTAVAVVVRAGQQRGGTPQDAGRDAYQANCAGCHLADLSGQGDAAPLRGSAFLQAWGTRTTKELLSFMQLTMPPQRPGTLTPEQYLNIVAYILQQNGA